MFEGAFYKHPNCIDACIEVLHYFPVPGQDRAEVKVRWWRIKSGRIAYSLGVKETFIKPKAYWEEWEILS